MNKTMKATATFSNADHEGRITKGSVFETSLERAALLKRRGLAVPTAEATDEAAALAELEDVDLEGIEGTGEGGRILIGDVRAELEEETS